jgi:nucleoside-diphosphate-sugar epimerase
MQTHPPTRSSAPLAAVTGASGFIGRHLVGALAARGWRTRLLLRRAPEPDAWPGVVPQVVAGSLGDPAALERLVEGADAVIHTAGLIKAARRAQFFHVNRDGTAALAAAVLRHAPHAHLLHVSSLAAREPRLSDYAASKRAGEQAALDALGTRATVLRPPAVYGPGDPETLLFFRLARQRFVPLPGTPSARAAMIHAADLASLMVLLAEQAPRGAVLTAADARPEGYSWDEVLGTAARAVGNGDARRVSAPLPLLYGIALVGDAGRLLGMSNMLNTQKLRELRHADWSAARDELARPPGWRPRYDLEAGFADAVAWYRGRGWLPA